MELLQRTKAVARNDVALLRRLGFTGYEATVWLELVGGYPVSAYQLAKRAGLQRANTYQALQRLLELGAVTLVNARPATYAPADPHALVGRLSSGLQAECERFASSMNRRMQSRQRGLISTASGHEVCLERLREELALTSRYAWLKGEVATLRLLEKQIESAAMRGAQVCIIAFGAWRSLQREWPNVTVVPHEGTAKRLSGATDSLLTLARDGVCVTTAVFSASPTVTSLQDHALTYQLHSYLLHEIYLAALARGTQGDAVMAELTRLRKTWRPSGMEAVLLG